MMPSTAVDAQPHRGWITAPQTDGPFLASLGIKLGRYDTEDGTFKDCEAPDEALARLDPHFGRYVWAFDDPSTKRKRSHTTEDGTPLALGLNALSKSWLDLRPNRPRSHGFHPSEMSKMCPVLHVLQERAREKLASDNPSEVGEAYGFLGAVTDARKKDFSSGLEMEFMVGDAVHDAIKYLLGVNGKLWGAWKCPECHHRTEVGWMPRVERAQLYDAAPCVHCHGRNLGYNVSWLYVEPTVPKNEWEILGHLDGDLRVTRDERQHRYVLEVKSAASVHFNRGELPKPDHLYQASLYGFLLGIAHICFIYVLKDQVRDWKEIILPVNKACVQDAMNKVNAVKWARQTGQLPTFARACKAIEEKRARMCPAVVRCFGCAPPVNWNAPPV